VIYVASETARGLAELGLERPRAPAGRAELERLLFGRLRARGEGAAYEELAEYGLAKLGGALWARGLARRERARAAFAVSPGMTEGTAFGGDYAGAPIMSFFDGARGARPPIRKRKVQHAMVRDFT
jgi:hypothetical protein